MSISARKQNPNFPTPMEKAYAIYQCGVVFPVTGHLELIDRFFD